MKAFVYSSHPFDEPFLREAAKLKHQLTFSDEPLNDDSIHLCAGNEALCVFSNDKLHASVLEKLHKMGVKYLALRSVGFDHVDMDAAEKLGMRVANVPEYSPYAIAEHGVAMLLALIRKLHEAEMLIEMQDFRLDTLVGFDLHQKTIGVIGTGKIGFAFAKIMHGFGCKLLAFDPVENENAENIGMKYTSLQNLLKESDVISLNCPLNESTKYMLNTDEFALMKPNCILINTARGAVVNTDAMLSALENGKLGGACLDVYEREKGLFFFDWRDKIIQDPFYARLKNLRNVFITGHQAFLTREALEGIASTTIDNLSKWEQTGKSPNDLY